jgi:hypothetical protein
VTFAVGLLNAILNAVFSPSQESRNNLIGVSGETSCHFGLSLFLPAEYIVLHNVTIPTRNGTTQIDHVVVSRYGIHVIETKNVKGSIYGRPGERQWTVCLGSKKHTMFNPLLQNRGHINALASVLQLPVSTFHSIVFFWSEHCRLKTPMPENVLTEGLCSYIKSKRAILIAPQKLASVVNAIQTARLPETDATAREHVARLSERFHPRL